MKLQKEKNGWVYILESNNFIKVGITYGTLEARLKNYKTHNPHEIHVIKSVFVANPELLEQEILDKVFKSTQHGTDWFEYNLETLNWMIQHIDDYQKNHFGIIPSKDEAKKHDLVNLKIPFTMVANCVLNDNTLTARAKGLYAYLYSKPETWDFSYIRIAKDHKESKNTILSAIQELEKAGYLERRKLTTGRTEYLLTYEPMTKIRSQAPVTKLGSDQTWVRPKVGHVSNKDTEIKKEDIATGVAREFSLAEEIKKMEDSPRRDINIIALYLDIKKPDLKNKDQLSVAIKRHLRPAQTLKVFTDDQILRGVDKAKKLTSEWTIETVAKCLTK